MKRDCLSVSHPAVGFCYFFCTVGFGMCLLHPACLAISFVCSLLYSMWLKRSRRERLETLLLSLAVIAFTTVFNPLFNHGGETVLWYFPSGNALTLEALCYGAAAGMMLATVLNWLGCFHKVMSTDHLVYLFGRALPACALVLSMVLRFVPMLKRQWALTTAAQQGLTGNVKHTGLQRAKDGLHVCSAMISWGLEHAVETADSMKGRGYGLPGRTAFSIFYFGLRDAMMLAVTIICSVWVLAGIICGALEWHYLPHLGSFAEIGKTVAALVGYALMCVWPMLLNGWEGLKWKRSKLKI